MTDDQETQSPESAPASAATSPSRRRRRGRTQSYETALPSGSASCTSEERVSSSSSSSMTSEADEEEDESRFVDLNYLFTNDKLKKEPPMAVLRSDPFCIPRVTDNVPEYRPRFNPLSILEHEESLLPGYFRLDPHEGVPGVPQHAWQQQQQYRQHDKENSLNEQMDHQHHQRPPLAAKRGRECEIVVPDDSIVSSSYEDALTSAASSPSASSPQIASLSIHTPTAVGSSTSGLFGDILATPEPPLTPFGGKRSSAMLMGTLPRRHSEAFADIPVPDLIMQLPQSTSSSFPTTSPAYSSTFAGKGYRNWDELTATTNDSISPSVLSDASFLASLQHTAGATNGSVDGHNPASPLTINIGDKLMSYLPSRDGVQDEDHVVSGFLSASDGLNYDEFQRSKAIATAHFFPPQPTNGRSSSGGSTPQPKKPRSKNIFRPCTAPGCTKGARGKSGLCQKHGGGKRCATPNCSKGAQGSSNMCLFHGGGYRCTVKGCQTGARGTSGLCAKHGGYKRSKSIEGRMSDMADDYVRMDPMSPMDRAPLLL